MHGGHFVAGGIAAGLLGNYWCHRTGRETCSNKTRRLPPVVVDVALRGFHHWFMRHLYG